MINLILWNSCSQSAENFLPQEAFDSGDVIGFHNWWSRSGMLLDILQCPGQSSTAKSHPAPNVGSAKVEKPCFKSKRLDLIS